MCNNLQMSSSFALFLAETYLENFRQTHDIDHRNSFFYMFVLYLVKTSNSFYRSTVWHRIWSLHIKVQLSYKISSNVDVICKAVYIIKGNVQSVTHQFSHWHAAVHTIHDITVC